MRVTIQVLTFACAIATSGCAGVPQIYNSRVTVSQVVERVQCELHDAVANNQRVYPWLKGWTAKFVLTLTVEEEAGLDPDNSFIKTVSDGTFTLGIGANYHRKATRTASIEFTVGLDQASVYECTAPAPSGRWLDANLGISEWISDVGSAVDRDDNVSQPDAFGEIIEFEAVVGGKFEPGFALVRFEGPGSLFGNRTDTHNLNIAFAPPEKKAQTAAGEAGPATTNTLNRTLDRQQNQLLFRNDD